MRIGIEIETHVPRSVAVGSWSTGRNNTNLEGWTACSDSTIHPPRGSGRRGCEFKLTRPLQLIEANLEKIAKDVRYMKDVLDANVNASCGLHIHIEWNSNDLKKLRRLVHTVAHYEEAFFGVTGTKKRKVGRWSRSIKSSHQHINYRRGRRSMGLYNNIAHSLNGDRYKVLNLQPLLNGRRNAVEFRVFAGTLNVNKIIGAICMCAGVVESCLGRTSTPKWNAPTEDRDSYRASGEAELTLTRLFYRLGWWPKKSRKGVDELIKASENGLDVPTLKTIKKTMIEMCKKYDAASRRASRRTA
ncbi:hypothetical protein LCGC14_1584880 [marine sediment metagenome]|uniref:Amidoligase enzyme n=1 Tax=marine sediment metagenome TaxID=412755 RepID=A0A0F9LG12_9ZZZZ